LGYIGASVWLAFDKKGKEAYFLEDATETTFQAAVAYKISHPTLTILTQDWGYFQRAYEKKDSYWSKYDVFLVILLTGGVAGLYWAVISCIELSKFKNSDWDRAKLVQ